MNTEAMNGPAPPIPDASTPSVDAVTRALVELREWAGSPSYARIAHRVCGTRLARGVPAAEARVARSTVHDCFRLGRQRLDADLVMEIVAALGAGSTASLWRDALRRLGNRADLPRAVGVQRVLPPSTDVLVGRDDELAALVPLVRSTVVSGMAGVGKTLLAHEVARRVAGSFAEVLVMNLQGFSSELPPVATEAARDAILATLLNGQLPPVQRRWEVLRQQLQLKPILLVLDNAASFDQVSRLLPPEPSRALVTSRVFVGEATERGADTLRLQGLSGHAASLLVADQAGLEPSDARECAEQLMQLTGGLRLALSLLARRVVARPGWDLRDHLTAEERRREHLQMDNSIESELLQSYEALTDRARRVLRWSAIAPGTDLSQPALSSVVELPQEELSPALAELDRAHLVQLASSRLEMHDLVRLFAVRRSLDEDRAVEVRAAMDRLLDYYANWGRTAGSLSDDPGRDDWPDTAEPEPLASFESAEDATTWWTTEAGAVLAAATWADLRGHDRHLVRLVPLVTHQLWQGPEAEATLNLHRRMLAAAQRLADPWASCVASRYVGQSLYRAGHPDAAEPHLRRALREAKALGAPSQVAACRSALSLVLTLGDDQTEGVALLEAAVEHYDTRPEDQRRAVLRSNLAVSHYNEGRHDVSRRLLEEALALAVERGWLRSEQWASSNLTELLLAERSVERARELASRASAIARERGDDVGAGYALTSLALAELANNDVAAASAAAVSAVEVAEGLSHPSLHAAALSTLGDVDRVAGRHDRARASYRLALDVATAGGDSHERQRAAAGLETV